MDITLEDKTKELMEESRMLLVQFAIDRVSLGVHSMGEVLLLYLKERRWQAELCPFHTNYTNLIKPINKFYKFNLQVWLLFSDSKSMTTFVNDAWKSFIKLTPGWEKKLEHNIWHRFKWTSMSFCNSPLICNHFKSESSCYEVKNWNKV